MVAFCGRCILDSRGQNPPEQSLYRISLHHKPRTRYEAATQAMLLMGMEFDPIDVLVHNFHEGNESNSEAWLEWKQLALEQWSSDRYASHSGRVDAFWRTIVLDQKEVSGRATPEIGDNFEMLLIRVSVSPAGDSPEQSMPETDFQL